MDAGRLLWFNVMRDDASCNQSVLPSIHFKAEHGLRPVGRSNGREPRWNDATGIAGNQDFVTDAEGGERVAIAVVEAGNEKVARAGLEDRATLGEERMESGRYEGMDRVHAAGAHDAGD